MIVPLQGDQLSLEIEFTEVAPDFQHVGLTVQHRASGLQGTVERIARGRKPVVVRWDNGQVAAYSNDELHDYGYRPLSNPPQPNPNKVKSGNQKILEQAHTYSREFQNVLRHANEDTLLAALATLRQNRTKQPRRLEAIQGRLLDLERLRSHPPVAPEIEKRPKIKIFRYVIRADDRHGEPHTYDWIHKVFTPCTWDQKVYNSVGAAKAARYQLRNHPQFQPGGNLEGAELYVFDLENQVRIEAESVTAPCGIQYRRKHPLGIVGEPQPIEQEREREDNLDPEHLPSCPECGGAMNPPYTDCDCCGWKAAPQSRTPHGSPPIQKCPVCEGKISSIAHDGSIVCLTPGCDWASWVMPPEITPGIPPEPELKPDASSEEAQLRQARQALLAEVDALRRSGPIAPTGCWIEAYEASKTLADGTRVKFRYWRVKAYEAIFEDGSGQSKRSLHLGTEDNPHYQDWTERIRRRNEITQRERLADKLDRQILKLTQKGSRKRPAAP